MHDNSWLRWLPWRAYRNCSGNLYMALRWRGKWHQFVVEKIRDHAGDMDLVNLIPDEPAS